MAFVQITDPDKAMELYRAGLLWEKRLFDGEPYEVAYGWLHDSSSGIRANIRDTVSPAYEFYVLLEE